MPTRAVEAAARQAQLEVDAGLLDGAVPLVDAALGVLDVLVAQHLVHRVAQRHVFGSNVARAASSDRDLHGVGALERPVVVVALFLRAALEAAPKKVAAFDDTSPPNRSRRASTRS
jgi:hypothetical protein